MQQITDTNKITQLFATFVADQNGAIPTNRVIGNDTQEWSERGTIGGEPAKIYYVFTADEADKEDGCDIPFDAAHINRIEIAEKDQDGEYDTL